MVTAWGGSENCRAISSCAMPRRSAERSGRLAGLRREAISQTAGKEVAVSSRAWSQVMLANLSRAAAAVLCPALRSCDGVTRPG